MQVQEIIISPHFDESLERVIRQHPHDKLFILTDQTTHELCWPVMEHLPYLQTAIHLVIPATDQHKNLETLAKVWQMLGEKGGTRHSLLINLGGGMITDLGGFAASTFKRGICYINIPTTLLAMVDASVGGKTGINFNGLKNEIGVFNPAACVLLNTRFLQTLDYPNVCSGYAEMLKHGLISNEAHWTELIRFDLNRIDYSRLQQMVGDSVAIKEKVVKEDPLEKGIRKALNLGHTAGHALESLALEEKGPYCTGMLWSGAWSASCILAACIPDFLRKNCARLLISSKHITARLPLHAKSTSGCISLCCTTRRILPGQLTLPCLETSETSGSTRLPIKKRYSICWISIAKLWGVNILYLFTIKNQLS